MNGAIVALTTDEMFAINFAVTAQDTILGNKIFYELKLILFVDISCWKTLGKNLLFWAP